MPKVLAALILAGSSIALAPFVWPMTLRPFPSAG